MNDLLTRAGPSSRSYVMSGRFDTLRVERGLFAAVVAFTIVSLVGFASFSTSFGLSLTAGVLSKSDLLRQIYGIAYPLFAQGHVALTAGFLLWHVSTRIGWPAFSGFLLIGSATFMIEWIGTSTALPFGEYAYGSALGPKIAGAVPIWIPVSWYTIAIPAYVLALKTFSGNKWRLRRIVSGAFLVTLWDVVLDPAMSGLTGYWIWSETGLFFGMPLKNLVGWFLTGIVIMLVLELLGGAWWGRQLSYPLMRTYYGLLLVLPGGMLLAAGEWAPVVVAGSAIAVALGVGMVLRPRKVARRVEDMPSKTVDAESADDFFWAHSRSFSFASMAFPARQRRLVGLVYAFCRITDDIVDETEAGSEDVHRRLEEWLREARKAYRGDTTADDWLHELMATSRAHSVPFSVIEDLVHGVGRDMEPPSFKTTEELLDYCYGVASTVGVWLCHLNDVRDDWMLERAAALGRAMQITNIIRDVGEDLERGRLYIPGDLLDRFGLTEEELHSARGDGKVPASYRTVMDEMKAIADEQYARAWEAIPRLPRGFATPTAIAADVYRGIQSVVARNGYDNLNRRARTSFMMKLVLATKAWCVLQWRKLLLRLSPGSVVSVTATAVVLLSIGHPEASAGQLADEILPQLRNLYIEAGDERRAIEEAERLIDGLSEDERSAPEIRAYGGAFEVVRAKHAFWPFSKLNHVKRGLPVLDRLVEAHSDNAEVRFLRLVSCYYLPGIMGRNDTVRDDLSALCSLLPSSREAFPEAWYRRMVSFVLGSTDIDSSCRVELQGILSSSTRLPDSTGVPIQ